jgi:hypothetical protein
MQKQKIKEFEKKKIIESFSFLNFDICQDIDVALRHFRN